VDQLGASLCGSKAGDRELLMSEPWARSVARLSVIPMITVSRLLKSWATPPVIRPIASNRCDVVT